jgi:hypothetical protein
MSIIEIHKSFSGGRGMQYYHDRRSKIDAKQRRYLCFDVLVNLLVFPPCLRLRNRMATSYLL